MTDHTNEDFLMTLTTKVLWAIGKEYGVKRLFGCRKAALAHWIAVDLKRRLECEACGHSWWVQTGPDPDDARDAARDDAMTGDR